MLKLDSLGYTKTILNRNEKVWVDHVETKVSFNKR